jgi:predicted phage terminase large subunit-like protein
MNLIRPEDLDAANAYDSLASWAKMIFPDFETPDYMLRLIDLLERMERGEVRRAIVCMPPRHGKSLLSSIAFPSWWMGRNPGHEVMITSYSASLSEGFSRQARDAIVQHGGPVFDVKVSQDSRSVESWALDGHRGRFHSQGVGGSLTGKGGNLIVVDDAVRGDEEAFSETARANLRNWYSSTLHTRLAAQPPGCLLVVMTRWHEADLVGWLLEQEKEGGEQFEKLILPMVDDSGEHDVFTGKILWESRWPRAAVLAKKRAVSSRVWESLYQQRPSNPEGSTFKQGHLKFYRSRPEKFDRVITSWDMSFKDAKGADFCCGQVWGRIGSMAFLLDEIRKRMGSAEALREVRALKMKWPESRETVIEDKANGPAVVDLLKREITGLIAVTPLGGKEARANACQVYFEAGNIHLPEPAIAPWINDTVAELLAFPNGRFDDRVDAMTQALARLMKGSSGGYFASAIWGNPPAPSAQSFGTADGTGDGYSRPDHSSDYDGPGSRRLGDCSFIGF